jgi:hypothetical protein
MRTFTELSLFSLRITSNERVFFFFVVGQGFHLNRAKHVHAVYLSELLGHSCFALFFKLLNTGVHRVMHKSNPECELLPVLIGNGLCVAEIV